MSDDERTADPLMACNEAIKHYMALAARETEQAQIHYRKAQEAEERALAARNDAHRWEEARTLWQQREGDKPEQPDASWDTMPLLGDKGVIDNPNDVVVRPAGTVHFRSLLGEPGEPYIGGGMRPFGREIS